MSQHVNSPFIRPQRILEHPELPGLGIMYLLTRSSNRM